MPSTISKRAPGTPVQYGLLGVLLGLAFPVVATVIQISSGALGGDLASILAAHQTLPLYWIIDTAPLFLGIAAFMVGRQETLVRGLQEDLAEASEKRVRALYEVVSNPDWSPATQMHEMLRIGCELLGMEIGIVSRVEGESFTIESIHSSGRVLSAGQVFDREETFSGITLGAGELTALDHIGASEWRDHPAYQAQALEAYLGIPLAIHGETFGTLSFSNPSPRPRPFREADRDLIRLMGRWVTAVIERQITADELAMNMKRIEAILETSVEGIIAIDEHGLIGNFNPAAEKTFGYSADEVMGQNVSLLMPEPHRSSHDSYMKAYLRSGDAKIIGSGREVEGRRRDGSVFPMALSVGEMVLPDGSRGFVGVLTDITERKVAENRLVEAKEQAEAASRAKGEFVARVSHEVRTPMNGILGMTDLALETELTAEQREYLQMVRSSGEALMDTINDILDFSKIEAQKLVLDEIEFRLHDMLGQALKPLALTAHEKGLELLYREETVVPEALVGDPGRLRQVVVNLVGNAIKFTHAGEVEVEVREARLGAGRVELHFVVSDTGIGIPPDRLDSIFESFEQADGSTTRTYGGTGLGLAICRQLTGLMGGRIWAESHEGRGSSFHFTVSLAINDPEAPFRPSGFPPELGSPRALLVDDHAGTRESLTHFFRAWGLEAQAAGTSQEALEELTAAARLGQPFDLILMDLHMPETDGFALAEAFRRDPAVPSPKVILMTSSGRQGDGARCTELGVSGYLLKPLLPSELLEAVLVAMGMTEAPTEEPLLVTRHSLQERRSALSILVAEDNPVNERLIRELLQRRGHSVEVVPDGELAVERAASEAFDLVLMDLGMPRVDGLEATRRIRDLEEGTGNHVPIVALTAHAMVEQREECLATGMDGYLSKPLNPEALNHLLDHFGKRTPESQGAESGSGAPKAQGPSPNSATSRERGDAPIMDKADAAKPIRSGTLPPAFDREHTISFLDGDRELLDEIIPMFLEDSRDLLGRIKAGLAAPDAPAVEAAAHQLKGTAAHFRAERVRQLADRIEESSRGADLEDVSSAFPDLENALAALTEDLTDFLKS